MQQERGVHAAERWGRKVRLEFNAKAHRRKVNQ